MAAQEVVLRPKSEWQKPNCIRGLTTEGCQNPSTQEACIGSADGMRVAAVRCCTNPGCARFAKELAQDLWEAMDT